MEETWGLKDYSDGETIFSIDPVCGMKVNESEAAGGKSQYAGETYYFCSDACHKAFGEDPAKYIGQRA